MLLFPYLGIKPPPPNPRFLNLSIYYLFRIDRHSDETEFMRSYHTPLLPSTGAVLDCNDLLYIYQLSFFPPSRYESRLELTISRTPGAGTTWASVTDTTLQFPPVRYPLGMSIRCQINRCVCMYVCSQITLITDQLRWPSQPLHGVCASYKGLANVAAGFVPGVDISFACFRVTELVGWFGW